MKIARILHAGYIFEAHEVQILFDPIFENPFSQNCFAFPEVEFDHQKIRELKPTAIFISHFHDDHCSLVSLDLLNRQTPIYLFCVHEELFSMIRELGFENLHSLKLGVAIEIGPFNITPLRALDADVDSLFQIEAEGIKILNVVDSWIDEEILEKLRVLSPWDLVLWPFQTMREIEVLSPSRSSPADLNMPQEWVRPLQALNPKIVVPSSCQFQHESWSWYNFLMFPISYKSFAVQIRAILPAVEVVRMNPGVKFVLNDEGFIASNPLSWVTIRGNQNADYLFDEKQIIPATCEVSKNFPVLHATQTDQVLSYCRQGLIEKFNSLELTDESFFAQSRCWKLIVYNHEGEPFEFFYQLVGKRMQMMKISDSKILLNKTFDWLTEVPMARLYGALENGEALTSMYIRINDFSYDINREAELKDRDVFEDPLIQCLFSDSFGSYQKAQLKKLLSK